MFLNTDRRHLPCHLSESSKVYCESDILFKYTNLIHFTQCDLPEEIKMLKEKIYNKIVINRECAIHDPDNF